MWEESERDRVKEIQKTNYAYFSGKKSLVNLPMSEYSEEDNLRYIRNKNKTKEGI